MQKSNLDIQSKKYFWQIFRNQNHLLPEDNWTKKLQDIRMPKLPQLTVILGRQYPATCLKIKSSISSLSKYSLSHHRLNQIIRKKIWQKTWDDKMNNLIGHIHFYRMIYVALNHSFGHPRSTPLGCLRFAKNPLGQEESLSYNYSHIENNWTLWYEILLMLWTDSGNSINAPVQPLRSAVYSVPKYQNLLHLNLSRFWLST